jgi:uroporphyrinogen-III synthase
MSSAQIRILSTRPLDGPLLELAAEKNIVIDTLSFIDTASIRDEYLDQQVRNLGARQLTAVFTSMNAVTAVTGKLRDPRYVSWKVFCIGAATKELVQEHFGAASIAGTAPSAAELAAEIIQHAPAEVFFFCGDARRDELPDKLSAAGIGVNELIVYRTTQTPYIVKTPYDGIAFFSPSAVHSFFSINATDEDAIFFAIGQTTAGAIRTYTDNPIVLSKTPEKEMLVRQIIDYFQTNI